MPGPPAGSGAPGPAAGRGTPGPAAGSGSPVTDAGSVTPGPDAGIGTPAPRSEGGFPGADAGGGTQILDPAGEATEIVGPADPGAGPPAPPLARPGGGSASAGPEPGSPGRPASTRPVPGPPVREGSRPGGGVPGAVHRVGPGGPRIHDGRRRGRVRLTVLAAVVLPVIAYVAAVQVLGGDEEPQSAATPTTVTAAVATTARPPATAAATCRWSRPEVGTQARSAPLAAIRAHMGWSDPFVVDEMRAWTASDGNWRWYVKAHQEQHPSRRGRWLVGQQEDGQRLVLASAGFTTKGYAARDWRPADGQQDQLAAVAGCLAGT
jgi:hypothetical protein